jgi:uncharacterized protein YeaO (DUF488 family)
MAAQVIDERETRELTEDEKREASERQQKEKQLIDFRNRYNNPNLLSQYTWEQLKVAAQDGSLKAAGFGDIKWDEKAGKFHTPSMFNDHPITLKSDGKGGVMPVAEEAHSGWIMEHKKDLWKLAAAAAAMYFGPGILQSLGGSGAAGLSSAELAAAGNSVGALSAAEVAAAGTASLAGTGLTAAEILATGAGGVGAAGAAAGSGLLSGAEMAATYGGKVGAMTAAQVAAGGSGVAGLTAAEIAGASAASSGLMSGAEMAAKYGSKVGALTPAEVAAGGSGVAPLTAAEIAGDGAASSGLMSGAEMAAKYGSKVGALTPAQVAAGGSGVKALTAAEIAGGAASGFDWNKLIKPATSLVGSYLNEKAVKDNVSQQNEFNKDYYEGLDKKQQDRMTAANLTANTSLQSMTPAQKALYSAQIDTNQAGLLSKAGLENMAAKYDASARNTQASSLLGAASTASDMAKFTPYGITTRFGKSDETGNYKLTDDVKAQQDKLMGASEGFLNQFTNSQSATAPMSDASRRMMELGQGYLTGSPQEQAAKWMTDQRALLEPQRAEQISSLNSRLAGQGRLGLSMGGGAGMMSSNPELAAYYNAQRMQDLQMAAQATREGQNYAQFGVGMVGQGGQTLRDMYSTQSAAYAPYQTAIGGANDLEKLGQNALTIGTDLGVKRASAGANAGQLYLNGATSAANAAYAGAAPAAQYEDYLKAQQSGINQQTGLQKTQADLQAEYDQAHTQYGFDAGQANMFAQAATRIPQGTAPQATPANSPWGNLLTGFGS